MKAYFTFGALTREIGTKTTALIQKGSFGAVFRGKGFMAGFCTCGLWLVPVAVSNSHHCRATFAPEETYNNAPGLKASAYAGLGLKVPPHLP
jgi:hypothetical protein